MKRALTRPLIIACMLLVAGAAAASATKPAAKSARTTRTRAAHHRSAPVAAVKSAPAGAAGMRIFRDPDTGEIGPPTAANVAQIARENPPEEFTNLPQVALPGGGYELLIDGKIEDAVVVKKDKHGKLVWQCTQDPHAAHKAPVVATPQREDR